jgi:hypothetical protein
MKRRVQFKPAFSVCRRTSGVSPSDRRDGVTRTKAGDLNSPPPISRDSSKGGAEAANNRRATYTPRVPIPPVAVTCVAHRLCQIIWLLLTEKRPYVEILPDRSDPKMTVAGRQPRPSLASRR